MARWRPNPNPNPNPTPTANPNPNTPTRAGREAYIILAATELTNAVIDNHEAPMVLSSLTLIMKS